MEFGFRQLAAWREAVGELILDLPGTVSLDLDEMRNRLVVGYASTADRNELQQVLNRARVPNTAVLVVTEEPVVRTQATLDSRVRPLTSGTRFGGYSQDWGPSHNYSGWWTAINWCTLGVPAIRQGVQVLLVVSHCTAREGALDDDPLNWVSYYIGQDWYPAITGQTGFFPPAPFGYNPFGTELFDRAGWTCGPAHDRRPCRHAETAVWDLSGMEVGFGETPFVLGRIARTTGSLPGTNPAGFTRTSILPVPISRLLGRW